MDLSSQMDQFRQQMGKILSPRSNGELKEATAWIESFRKATQVELVMISMLSTPFESPLSGGEVILLSQALLWRITRMPSSSVAGVDVSFLLQYATTLHSIRGAQVNLYLMVATLVIRMGLISTPPSLTVISSFLDTFDEVLDAQSVVQILKLIPEVVNNTLLYRGNKEASALAMTTMCCQVLYELPVVLTSLDILLTAVLGADAASFANQIPRQWLEDGDGHYTCLLDSVQAALNWITLYTSTYERCHAANLASEQQIQTQTQVFCSPAYDNVWLQSQVVTLSLSILRGMLTPSSTASLGSGVCVEDNALRLYKLCAEVVFDLLQKHWASELAQANVTETILATTSTLMDDVSSHYRGLHRALSTRQDTTLILNIINDMATQFESSYLGVAFSVLASESIWLTFRQFALKLKTEDSFQEQSGLQLQQQLCQSWQQYFICLIAFMRQFNEELCNCTACTDRDDKPCACPFTHLCDPAAADPAAAVIAVSESHFSARILSLRMFTTMLPLWRGLLEDDEDDGGGSLPSALMTAAVFTDSSDNDLVLEGVTCLILSAKLTNHTCVMIRQLIKDGSSCLGFAQSVYSQHWEDEYGEEFSTFRKDFRDMLRSIGSTSSLLFQSLLAQTAGIAAPDTLAMLRHPGYELLFGPIYTHMWLFRTIVSEVSHVAQTLSAAPGGNAVSGDQLLTIEALLHAASALCSGDGVNVWSYIPASDLAAHLGAPDVQHLLSQRNTEAATLLYTIMNTLFQFSQQLLEPPCPLLAFSSPLLRLVVVLVIDLFKPLLTHIVGNYTTTEESGYAELCGFTKSCCELLLQSAYLPEFNVVDNSGDGARSQSMLPSQVSFIGAILPFRVKQDHIGCVSLLKLTLLIRQLARPPSTRQVLSHLATVIAGSSIPAAVLPLLLHHAPQDAILSSLAASSAPYTSQLFTEVVSNALDFHGKRAESTSDVVLLWVKVCMQHCLSFVRVRNGALSSPGMSWRSFLLLHESTLTILESLSFATFSAGVEDLIPGEMQRDTAFLHQAKSITIRHCSYWYISIVLPVMNLLLESLQPSSGGGRGGEGGGEWPSMDLDLGVDDLLSSLLALCGCAAQDEAAWLRTSKANICAVGELYQQNLATSNQFLSPDDKRFFTFSFFELLANSVRLSMKLSFSTLQYVLTDDHTTAWMQYACLYHQLSTIVSLLLHCILPFSKKLLTSIATTQTISQVDMERRLDVMQGLTVLVDACCVPPPAVLVKSQSQAALPDHSLLALLASHPPGQSCCSRAAPGVEFSHVLVCLQELASVVVSMLDMHIESIGNISAEGGEASSPQIVLHFRGLMSCLKSSVEIIKALSQWPVFIGDRLGLCQHMFGLTTTKVFAVLGWNEETCSCSSTCVIPDVFYGTLILFWIQCFEFQQKEQQQEQNMIHLGTPALSLCRDIPFEQRCAIIQFTISVSTYFQAKGTDSRGMDKHTLQVMNTFFSRYVQVLSLCLGVLPNLNTTHSLDADGLINPSCLMNIQCTENPYGEHSFIEHLLVSGVGQALLNSVSSLMRASLTGGPANVKDTCLRLFFKCLMVFGATISAEFLQHSAFQSVGGTVTKLSLTGQWKKIKNVVKTLSK